MGNEYYLTIEPLPFTIDGLVDMKMAEHVGVESYNN